MLTHEKVLKVFGPYLDADPDYEVVKTSRGYTLLAWNNRREEWFSAEFCKTPEDLRDALLDAYVNYLEYVVTDEDRDPTEQEMREKNPSGKAFILRSFISRQEKGISRQEIGISRQESTQSREEQRTEEQRTVEDSRAEQTREEKAVTADSGLTTELEEKLNCKFDHNFCLELRRLQNKGMQREVFLDTARQTAENAPRNPAGYFRTLLQNCERDGILTAEDMQKRAKPAPAQPAIGPSSEQLSAFNQEWYERVKRYTREKAVPS